MTPLSHAQKAVAENPAKITADEFYAMIEENPSVFEHWDTPLEITEYINCQYSNITHLSPHLTFSARDKHGWSATFDYCVDLKIATGNFKSYVYFGSSGIKKIENLHILHSNPNGNAANFYNCKSLQIATGTYPGFVSFESSGIHSIKDLHIQTPNKQKKYTDFKDCQRLHILQGWDLSKEIYIESEKLESEIKRRSVQKFIRETGPQELPFL
jgi:hypothetical protein